VKPTTKPLWTPTEDAVAAANITRFADYARDAFGAPAGGYRDLHRWSVDQAEDFWRAVWRFCGIIGEGGDGAVVKDREQMPGAQWFPEARLNFAENLLCGGDDGDRPAIIFRGENGATRRLSHAELRNHAARIAEALAQLGVAPGDRVAAYIPNIPEAVTAMLAAAALGAVWSSCSPDFGARGVLDRFGQIGPKVLFCADGYFYNGKRHDCLEKVRAIQAGLPALEKVVVIPHAAERPDISAMKDTVLLADFAPVSPNRAAGAAIPFRRLPFNHPLYIMYSSGTTGAPKCIVHGAGGTLLQHVKEHQLHCDVRRGERLFFFTTCGWMMWNWLASGLASGACLMLYDGSPFVPRADALLDFAAEERIGIFGVSAKYLDALGKAGAGPARTHDLAALRAVLSTGSPLSPEGFDFVYEKIKSDVCLSSISGGTDIMGCFVLGNPALPVRRGEIQCAALGMKVAALDDHGADLPPEKKGELACRAPFPSMPVAFWNDPGGHKYRAAYFEKFPGTWCHGDYIAFTESGGAIIYGRSDAVLNPGGVRIGTAEIYREAEKVDEVMESLVIGQRWRGDVRVVLFVRLRDGARLDAALSEKITAAIRRNATPRHAPAKIIQVADIPRTRSGKIVELAVRSVVHGEEVKNKEALANPEALALFAGLAELAKE